MPAVTMWSSDGCIATAFTMDLCPNNTANEHAEHVPVIKLAVQSAEWSIYLERHVPCCELAFGVSWGPQQMNRN